MKKFGFWIVCLALAGLTCTAWEARAKGHILREGDVIKVRLGGSIGADVATGDTIPITVPEAWQRDPKGTPDIPAGTRGVITLKSGEKKPGETHFDVTSMVFYPEGHKVTAATQVSGDAGVLKVQKAGFIKKLLVPPLLGFLIWHDHGGLDEGSDLSVEIRKRADW